jgi:hypothetical protein
MPSTAQTTTHEDLNIDLRNPGWAAFWAWLLPGAGHLYQRRHAKGILFLVCILGTYFFGLNLGGGHVVYASWRPNDKRWQYFCQLGVGAAALPALVQSRLVRNGEEPLFGGLMAPPRFVSGTDNQFELQRDELARWHLDYHAYFDLGTLFTMIAGLLNILAIYDAYAGPMIMPLERSSDKPPPNGPAGRPAT